MWGWQVLFEAQGRSAKGKAVELEDMKFHQCVRLARFENDRTISFIPPDGAFDLMYALPRACNLDETKVHLCCNDTPEICMVLTLYALLALLSELLLYSVFKRTLAGIWWLACTRHSSILDRLTVAVFACSGSFMATFLIRMTHVMQVTCTKCLHIFWFQIMSCSAQPQGPWWKAKLAACLQSLFDHISPSYNPGFHLLMGLLQELSP